MPRLSGSASETDVAVLWTDADLRCVLSWLGDRYRVRLTRGDTIVREESGTDEDILLDAATRWRTEIALVEPARKDTRG